ncbi:transformer-2 protein homolog beta-like [Topomyia yanbarensis]|uniref:transformer-2 protein homolog beta-like n=1 Tax=Topomyia yanbarensis TaxID=2498891 RepID=UPI00273C98AB|nr:transformer-2 protein homolog beta-like [Topomyia yanbarensis]XP_058823538.1 transformer-2 protein homolog beta-like [Topomyia yanbarensis]XP_058823539.1 transformer-2 protein homolog beta-like [Topomyia yanbarensis]
MVQSRSRSRTPPRSYRRRRSSSTRQHSRKHSRGSGHRRHRHISCHSSTSRTTSSGSSFRSTPERIRPVDPPPNTCLGVFGLSNYTQESDLETIFGTYGSIEKVQIVYDAKTKASRGFGFVYFRELHDASAAKVRCNGMVVHERTIRVDYSVTERAHTPTPGIYMGERSAGRRRNRSSYSSRGRSYDDDYHYGRARRRESRSHRRRSSKHRRHRHRHETRSRSRSWSYSSVDSQRSKLNIR